jgi:hypothetical protein
MTSMNVGLSTEDLCAVATGYAESIDVPAFDASSVRVRRGAGEHARAVGAPPAWRRRLAAVAGAGVLLAFVTNAPAVIAQVQRVIEAFTFVNGQAVPLTVETVSLTQARSDMPFTVITPPSIPGFTASAIREMYSKPSRSDGRLLFDYQSARPGPPLTIEESSPAGSSDQNFFVVFRDRNSATQRVAPLPPAAPLRNGEPTVQLLGKDGSARFHPITWIASGTRIVLVSPPGMLSADQVNAIRAAMSR